MLGTATAVQMVYKDTRDIFRCWRPVWRMAAWQDILEKKTVLTAANLDNAATTEAGSTAIHSFAGIKIPGRKEKSMAVLDGVERGLDENLSRACIPPAASTMRVMDLARALCLRTMDESSGGDKGDHPVVAGRPEDGVRAINS